MKDQEQSALSALRCLSWMNLEFTSVHARVRTSVCWDSSDEEDFMPPVDLFRPRHSGPGECSSVTEKPTSNSVEVHI